MSDAGSAGPGGSTDPSTLAGAAPSELRNGRNSSIGMGKMVVELFSAAISVTVWRYRSWMALGSRASVRAAWAYVSEAWSSPCAAITLARRSRSASAWRAMARFI
jgi:hypothetical protein